MKIIALGSPGVGKGTYAAEITKKYNVLSISTGDLFRENIKNETELGKKAKEIIDSGKLVPDEVTIGMMKERLGREDTPNGFILDGFPRTIPQAEALSEFSEIDLVLNFKADKEVIMQRLTGRRTCSNCAAIFHVVNIPPKQEGVCDKCGGKLVQRSDELPEVIEERLKVYEEQTAPLIGYYQEKGLLKEVTVNEDFGKHKEEILDRIFKVIES
ncbi:adenylate kinase [Candidatus Woesearchaeota archaeon]|jgi:adenylate kinase|nr:adenylate kinase [Candidatus Woesearchaeota archaeon]